MAEEEKVEKFKLSGSQLAWVKEFKRVNQVSEQLAEGIQIRFGEMEQMQKAHAEVSGRKAELLKMAPLKDLEELPGQRSER